MSENKLIFRPAVLMANAQDFNWNNGLVVGTVAILDSELNIQMIISREPNKGNCQQCISDLKQYAKNKNLSLVSSTPSCDTFEYIANKFNLKIYK